MSRRRRSKRLCQMRHAKRRGWLRLGRQVTEAELRRLAAAVQAGKLRLLEIQSSRISVYAMPEDPDSALIYDRSRGLVVSFMPVKWVGKRKAEALPEKAAALARADEEARDA